MDAISIVMEAAHMHNNFLMHDNWDVGMPKNISRRVKSNQKRYVRIFNKLKTLKKAK